MLLQECVLAACVLALQEGVLLQELVPAVQHLLSDSRNHREFKSSCKKRSGADGPRGLRVRAGLWCGGDAVCL